MVPRLKNAEYLGDYRLRLSFDDGTEGDIDLEDELWGEVFEPLRDKELFKQFRVDTDLRTVVWPTGADLAPEYLFQKASV